MIEQGDRPSVEHPQLRALVELARAQRLPTLRTELPMIRAGVARRRHARARGVVFATVLAAAAVLLAWSLRQRGVELDARVRGEQAERVLDDPDGGVAIEPPHRDAAPRALPTEVPTPSVEPEPTEVVPETRPAPVPGEPTRKPVLDAAALARQAEQAMAEQRRGDAIRALVTLVRRYPRSSAARAALLDLGRLLRADGRRDEARCAYRQLVKRWPTDPMRTEIDRALASLGDGPACRGLQPARE
jgi:hypothetical protein